MTRAIPIDDLLERVAALIPAMRRNAVVCDEDAAFPNHDLEALRDVGALRLPLPANETDRHGAIDLLASVLTAIGSGNLAVGRIFEAHVNALRLITRYGTTSQQRTSQGGTLHALWVTDPPNGGLRMTPVPEGWLLTGSKMFCSGAGHVDRAVVTAAMETGEYQMLVVPSHQGEKTQALQSPLQGMRAAVTGTVDLSGIRITHEALLGRPGDYLREPEFSCGAWRGSAVALGGLSALLDATIDDLSARTRIGHPHQLARVGHALIARETSRLWVRDAARIAEDDRADPRAAVAYVGLARIAVESACLDAMRLVQRSLGLSAFRHGHPAERICRDLGTYLRQPAPDEVLTEAAAWFAHRPSFSRS
jgi:alkylation response protein AidB-like acyl-CoA dehydrogenase